MRKLLYCSLGDTNQFKWAERNGNVWEDHSLKCVEYGASELQDAYDSFEMVLAEMFRFEGLTDAVVHRIKLESITISYDKYWDNREVQIRGGYLMPVVLDIAKIVTPKMSDDITKDSTWTFKLNELLNRLEDECCRYIDGTRAQQTLNFGESANTAETQPAKAE